MTFARDLTVAGFFALAADLMNGCNVGIRLML